MIEFLKIKDVKDPIRELGNAGIDIFIPNCDKDFIKELIEKNEIVDFTEDELIIKPLSSILIPSGLKSKFENDMALLVTNKSGIALKKQLITGACVIDSSYQGEILIHLINVSLKEVRIKFGEKIVQIVPYKINNQDHSIALNQEDFYREKSNRGEGGFGSTGST